jgi:hypothetical protein
LTPLKFFGQFAAWFNFTAFNAKNVARETRPTPATTLGRVPRSPVGHHNTARAC